MVDSSSPVAWSSAGINFARNGLSCLPADDTSSERVCKLKERQIFSLILLLFIIIYLITLISDTELVIPVLRRGGNIASTILTPALPWLRSQPRIHN